MTNLFVMWSNLSCGALANCSISVMWSCWSLLQMTNLQCMHCPKVISQFRAMSTNHLRFSVTEISTRQKSIYDDDGNEAMTTRGTRRRSCWQRAIGLLYTLKTHFRPASKSKKPPQKQTPLFNSCSSKADPTLHIQAKEREASTFLPTAPQ